METILFFLQLPPLLEGAAKDLLMGAMAGLVAAVEAEAAAQEHQDKVIAAEMV
jgi:hypothetical protein